MKKILVFAALILSMTAVTDAGPLHGAMKVIAKGSVVAAKATAKGSKVVAAVAIKAVLIAAQAAW